MIHRKLPGLMSPIEKVARVAGSASDAARSLDTRPSGTVSYDNADGTRTVIGPAAGDRTVATHVGDTTAPPIPKGVSAWSGDGSLHVSWDGTLDGEVPADFDHVTILVDGEEVAKLSSAGSVTVGGVEAGATVSVAATAEDDACLADGTQAHNVSAACSAISVEIRDVAAEVRAEADTHGEQITQVQQSIADFKASAEATYATKTDVDDKTGAITKTLSADYTKTADLAATDAVKDAKKAGTDAQSQLAGYKSTVSETYAEKTELTQAVNQLTSTMSSNYSAFTDYRTTNDAALSKAQTAANDAQNTIDSYKTANDKAVADAKSAGPPAQTQLSSYKSSNDAAVAAAKKAGTDAKSNLDSYKTTTDKKIGELSNIANNAIESWYLKGVPTTSNAPAKNWTTDALKSQHAGDLYIDTDTGYSYRWSGTAWVQVKDSDVTKALNEIQSVKTDYATKSELKSTDEELSGKITSSLTTATQYTDGQISQEVTNRNAAIKAQADSISLDVSKTYTKSETFASYQSDADQRIATANSDAATAKSMAATAASDAATAKTNASTAVSTANGAVTTANAASSTANSAKSTAATAASDASKAKSDASSAVETANKAMEAVYATQASLKVADDKITSEVSARAQTDEVVASHTASISQLSGSIESAVSGETTYTAPDGTKKTNALATKVKQTADSLSLTITDVNSAKETANTAASDASKAKSDASSAVETANSAKTAADTANSNASSAVTTANAASTIASKASTDAAAAVKTANTANTNASSAVETANTASANASTAKDTAATAATDASKAKADASSAVETANKANTTASTANTNASKAVTTANGAKTAADTASTNASAAVKTANTANTNASSAVATANGAATTASTAKSTADGIATLIRAYSGGVLVCKTGCTVGALVNANGSFDVVTVSWNGDEPTVGTTITEYGNNRTVFYGPDGKGKSYMSDGKFSADELEAYSALYLPNYTLRETPNGGFGIYRRK